MHISVKYSTNEKIRDPLFKSLDELGGNISCALAHENIDDFMSRCLEYWMTKRRKVLQSDNAMHCS